LLRCRIYAPVGAHRELLPYLVRRLLENGANTSFIYQLHSPAVAIDALAAHPLQSWPLPLPALPNPLQLWPLRRNSQGIYLHNNSERTRFFTELENYRHRLYEATQVDFKFANHPVDQALADKKNSVCNPYNNQPIGSWYTTTTIQLDAAAARAREAQLAWQQSAVDTRAICLEKYADLLFEARAELVALMARETGKTIENGLDEVREAIDLCRYYAQQARQLLTKPIQLPGVTGEANRLSLSGRGTFACISPWNFPLAIFSGQIVAALVTGNAVLAKPAEQATLTAQLATRLLHRAGVPSALMQLLPGNGEIIGRQLCAHPNIDGIVFTGGWETARAIQQQVAQRDGAMIPFIAETAGLNTLIADSSAQPQQLVQDVIRSAFDSAGQRCSALRVLYLPEGSADDIEQLLCGALQQLALGDPLLWSTDIGPVIDREAHTELLDYIANQRNRGRVITQLATPTKGLFVAPTLLRLQHIDELTHEAFGPILHIIRYSEQALADVIEQINNCGYGLTCGIHSRNEQHALQLAQRLRVGNIYINRDIIGAVVEAQPFGGLGKSGTGPKAGGPHYLIRFTNEKTISINTSALGGDYRLLAQQPTK
jgi:RHH-type proline utilization regulon transcriptional repressor/proline dehydrogenase/delta 1-pyrroline-5-carboxylate dehydrogenase